MPPPPPPFFSGGAGGRRSQQRTPSGDGFGAGGRRPQQRSLAGDGFGGGSDLDRNRFARRDFAPAFIQARRPPGQWDRQPRWDRQPPSSDYDAPPPVIVGAGGRAARRQASPAAVERDDDDGDGDGGGDFSDDETPRSQSPQRPLAGPIAPREHSPLAVLSGPNALTARPNKAGDRGGGGNWTVTVRDSGKGVTNNSAYALAAAARRAAAATPDERRAVARQKVLEKRREKRREERKEERRRLKEEKAAAPPRLGDGVEPAHKEKYEAIQGEEKELKRREKEKLAREAAQRKAEKERLKKDQVLRNEPAFLNSSDGTPLNTFETRPISAVTPRPNLDKFARRNVEQLNEKKKIKGVGKISRRFDEVAFRAAQTELLLPESAGFLKAEGAERTYKFTQEQIKEAVDLNTQAKIFDLRLPDFGPYTADYTRNGRHLVIGGRKGHVATMDWKTKKMGCELHLGETVRDVKWLHNETLFAVAQKKFIYIYDNFGTEVHCLKEHLEPTHLDFLPYHFLLVSANGRGHLNYQDTSTGAMVVSMKTGMGPCRALAQNPWNAVMTMGHGDGVVTMWTPNHPTPVVNMLAHKGPVQAVAVDRGGNYMVTTGLDGRMKVFDVRTYKTLNEYYTPTPAAQLSISQLGLLAVGYGSHVTVWRNVLGEDKARSPYMYHHIADGSAVSRLRFCPYDDVLGVGHAGGFASLAVPGAGEPNYDAMEGVNPYITKEQRKTSEVRALLEKIQPDMIVLDPTAIGTVKGTGSVKGVAIPKILFEANNPGETYKPKEPKPALPRRPPRQQEQRIVKGSPMDPKASILIGGAANLTPKQRRRAAFKRYREQKREAEERRAAGIKRSAEDARMSRLLDRFKRKVRKVR